MDLYRSDEAADSLDLVALNARVTALTYAMSNGFGFVGVNANILLHKL